MKLTRILSETCSGLVKIIQIDQIYISFNHVVRDCRLRLDCRLPSDCRLRLDCRLPSDCRLRLDCRLPFGYILPFDCILPHDISDCRLPLDCRLPSDCILPPTASVTVDFNLTVENTGCRF